MNRTPLTIATWLMALLCGLTLAAGVILTPTIWLLAAWPLALILAALVWLWQRETPEERHLRRLVAEDWERRRLREERERQGAVMANRSALAAQSKPKSAGTTGTTTLPSEPSPASREPTR